MQGETLILYANVLSIVTKEAVDSIHEERAHTLHGMVSQYCGGMGG